MITPEQAQKLSDLRSRMLENVKQGRPSHDGISKEEIAEGLAFIRQNRVVVQQNGEKKVKKGKAKEPLVEIDTSVFTDMNLD